jgi:hypothetical protein
VEKELQFDHGFYGIFLITPIPEMRDKENKQKRKKEKNKQTNTRKKRKDRKSVIKQQKMCANQSHSNLEIKGV